MEVGPGGIGQLVVAEGFFIGEKDMFKVLNKQGRRYRLRPSAEDRKAGKNVPGIFQLGPLQDPLGAMLPPVLVVMWMLPALRATRATEAWQDGPRSSRSRSWATDAELFEEAFSPRHLGSDSSRPCVHQKGMGPSCLPHASRYIYRCINPAEMLGKAWKC